MSALEQSFEDLLRGGLRTVERNAGVQGLETAVAPLAIQGAADFLPALAPLAQGLAPLARVFSVVQNLRQQVEAREQPPAQQAVAPGGQG